MIFFVNKHTTVKEKVQTNKKMQSFVGIEPGFLESKGNDYV